MPGLLGLFSLAVALVGLSAFAVSGSSGPRPSPQVIGGNLPINAGATDLADINAHNSPVLARNPVDPTNLAMANRIDSPVFSCALHVSFDAGARWTPTSIPAPAGEEPKCYAPDVAFGPDGTMHLLFVTLQGEGNLPNAVWTATSGDGGRTLSEPSRALGPLAFQVNLTADPERAGRLYLTWLQAGGTTALGFAEPGYPILAARSEDGGATWSTPASVSGPSRARVVAPSAAVGPTSHLYVAYLDLGDDRLDYEGAHEGQGGEPHEGPWQLIAARSGDGGSTWTESVVDARLIPAQRFIAFIPPTPSVAVEPDGGRVHVAFHDARLGDADVWVWTSTNGATRFGPAKRVNDTPRQDGTAQYLAGVAVAPDGRLDIVYYDRRDDPGDIANEVSFQSSYDGGTTFTRRLRLTDRPFDSRVGPGSERGMPELGSRLAVVPTEARALAVWADTRAGTDASRKQDLVRAVVAVHPPAQLARPLRLALRFGGAVMAVAGLSLFAAGVMGTRRARTSARHSPPPAGAPGPG